MDGLAHGNAPIEQAVEKADDERGLDVVAEPEGDAAHHIHYTVSGREKTDSEG